MLKICKALIFFIALAGFLTSFQVAAEVRVTFNKGGVIAVVGTNTQKWNNPVLLSSVGFTSAAFGQDLGDGATLFQIQGNDIPGTLTINYDESGVAKSAVIEGAIVSQDKNGGITDAFGFVPRADVSTTIGGVTVDGDSNDSDSSEGGARGESGDTIFGILVNSSSLVYTSGSNIQASADNPLGALNSYLGTQASSPSLSVIKTASDPVDNDSNGVDMGDVITYTYVATNSGDVTLTNVSIAETQADFTGTGTLPSPTYASGGSDQDSDSATDDLAVGESVTWTATYALTQADVNAGFVENQATATGSSPSGTGDVTDVSDDDGTNASDKTRKTFTGSSALTLIKTASDPVDNDSNGVDAGDVITYTYVATNSGNVTLTNVSIAEAQADFTGTGTLPSPAYASGGSDQDSDSATDDLAVGESVTWTATYALTQADVNAGFVENQATATGSSPSGTGDVTDVSDDDGTNASDKTRKTFTGSSALTLIKTASDPVDNDSNGVDVGDVITYTYVATNSGNVTLTNVSIAETQADFTGTGTLPSPAYASGGSDQDSDSATDDLAVGESVTWTATYALTQADVNAGFVENQAKATGSSPSGTGDVTDVSDDDGTNASDKTRKTFTGSSALTLIKTASDPADNDSNGVDVGDVITYTYVATNSGNVTLTNVSIAETQADFTGTGTLPSPAYASGGSDQDSDSATDDLAVGESVTWTATYALTQADVNAGFVENQATATGSSPSGTGDVTDVSDDDGTNASDKTRKTFTGSSALTLIKTASDPADNDSNGVDVGDVITYTYVATNSGNVTLTNVSIAETQADFTGTGTLPSPAYASGGSDQDSDSATDDLAVGESVTWTATYALTQADVNAGFVENQATATGSSPSGTGDVTDVSDDDGTNASDKTRKTFTGSSALTLIKTASDPADNDSNGVDVGDVITYTYVATNSGNVTLTNVSIAETQADFTGTGTLPSPVYASGGSDQDSDSATDDLAVGESVTWTATYALTQADVNAGFVENQAKATGSSPSGTGDVTDVSDDDGTNASDKTRKTFTGSSALTLIKTASDPADNDSNGVDVGDVITYTYVATNSGNVTLTNVSIAETQADFTGTGTLPSPVYASGGSDQDSDSATDDLAVGESVTWTATYALTQADVNAGFVENQAKATGSSPSGTGDVTDVSDDDGTNASDKTRKTFTGSSALTLIKTASDPADNDSNGVDVGDVITYTYVATNSGNVTLTNVSIAETQADFTGTGTLPSPVYASGGSDQDSDSATDDLAVGESVTWTATYALTQADVNAGFVENQAKATGSSPSGTGDVTDVSDDDGTNASDKTRKTFTGSSALTLIKTASDPADNDSNGVDVGDVITYTYVATNSGNVTLTNVSIAETQADFTGTGTLPSPVYASGGSDQDSDSATDDLAVGESVTWTATYALTQADVNAGFVENQAKATGSSPSGTGDVTDVSDDDGTNASDKTRKTFTGSSALTLIKTASDPADNDSNGVDVGDVITYTYVATNSGNVTLTNVSIAETQADFTGTGTLPSPVYASGGSDQDSDSATDDLAVGESVTWTATYALTQADVNAGFVENQAKATGSSPSGTGDVTDVSDDDGTNASDKTRKTFTGSSALTLIKTASDPADNDSNGVDVGDVITYTYVATNSGNVTLTNVSIAETQADFTGTGTLPSPAYASGGSDQDSDSATDDLAVGESVTWTATYALTQADVNAGFVENQAKATGSSPSGTGDVTDVSDDDGTNASDKTRKTFTGSSALTLIKTASDPADNDSNGVDVVMSSPTRMLRPTAAM